MSRYQSFVVRICIDRGQKAIRGKITDVRTRAASNFRDWDKMVDFIVSNAGELGREAGRVEQKRRPRQIAD